MLIAITGGIGAGKSTVLKMFGNLGCHVLDADDVAHELYNEPESEICRAMIARWGNGILTEDGRINRPAVARVVFPNADELSWLNNLVHPEIQRRILASASQYGSQPLFCAIPLLYENGWQCMVDRVIAIWCSENVQRQRLAARGWSQDEMRQRIASQMNMDRKLSLADYGIINDGTLEALRLQCEALYQF